MIRGLMLGPLRAMLCSVIAASPVAAQTTPALALLAPVAPVATCTSLANLDLAPVTGEATTIAAQEVAASRPYCAVTGTIAPAIRFEVRLPLAGWTQRYLQTGCGGLCGNLRISPEKAADCAPVTDGTIVLASTDMGHQGMNPSWGSNPQQRADFAHRGVHVTALVAKALIKAFYGQPQRFAYFSGCSDGGREALIEAQRFPDDFDGIAAGAPALNFAAQNSFHHGWLARSNSGSDGLPLLTAVDMPLLHKAVRDACDSLDGLVDGQITDPRQCRFDPAPLRCKEAAAPGKCLTAGAAEFEVAIAQGPALGANDGLQADVAVVAQADHAGCAAIRLAHQIELAFFRRLHQQGVGFAQRTQHGFVRGVAHGQRQGDARSGAGVFQLTAAARQAHQLGGLFDAVGGQQGQASHGRHGDRCGRCQQARGGQGGGQGQCGSSHSGSSVNREAPV